MQNNNNNLCTVYSDELEWIINIARNKLIIENATGVNMHHSKQRIGHLNVKNGIRWDPHTADVWIHARTRPQPELFEIISPILSDNRPEVRNNQTVLALEMESSQFHTFWHETELSSLESILLRSNISGTHFPSPPSVRHIHSFITERTRRLSAGMFPVSF